MAKRTLTCNHCRVSFEAYLSQNRKYCSKVCSNKNTLFKKGTRFNHSIEIKRKKRAREKTLGENNVNWKGDDVGYDALHDWVRRKLGTPDTCEVCEKSGLSGHKIHWANKSGEYKRDLNDWVRMCARCHGNMDGTTFKKNQTPWNKGIKGTGFGQFPENIYKRQVI